jgi:hypothetical protein
MQGVIIMWRRKKSIAFLVIFFMLVSLFTFQIPVLAADTGIRIQFNNGNTSINSNTINARFKITNTGSSSVNLATLKIRYYYTIDADKPQNFFCDHAGMLSGGSYVNLTRKITGRFEKISSKILTADTYLEVGFSSDAGAISSGGSIDIQTRVARTDWSSYDQSNDFSYKSAGSYIDWDQIAAFLNGTLIFGKEAGNEIGENDPEISPRSAVFDKYSPKDINVSLTPNGNTFKGINGLSKGSDYTVSGNTVIILKRYLSSQTLGTKRFTFDFGVSSNPVLTVTIKDSNPSTDKFNVRIKTLTGKTGAMVTVPINFENIAKVKNVGTCNFYIDYDPSLLEAVSVTAGDIIPNASVNLSSKISSGKISFVYLDNTIGDELITKDGVMASITFKILGEKGETANVKFDSTGAFGDENMTRIEDVKYIDGSIKIMGDIPSISPLETAFDKNSPKDVEIMLTQGETFKGIIGLKKDTDYTMSGNMVRILKNYLETLPIGTKMLIFDFGVEDNPSLQLTIKDTTHAETKLSAAIGTVTGKPGEIVDLPVTIANVEKSGNIGTCNFYVEYDPALLQAVFVSEGDIITNPAVNFTSKISSGLISCIFLDNTMGDELITEDGILLNIRFKILADENMTAKVCFKESGVFGNGDMVKVENTELKDGAVIIKAGEAENPTIDLTMAEVDKKNPTDIIVTLTSDGKSFKGITGLTEGTDYRVSGNTVTILMSYLMTLKEGTETLVFDFGIDKNPTLDLLIKEGTIVFDNLMVTIGKITGNNGDIVVLPVTLKNVEKAGDVGLINLKVIYDSDLLEARFVEAGDIVTNAETNFYSKISPGEIDFKYLNSTIGDEVITKDGALAYIIFRVLGSAQETAAVTFKAGTTISDGNMDKIDNVEYVDGGIDIVNNTPKVEKPEAAEESEPTKTPEATEGNEPSKTPEAAEGNEPSSTTPEAIKESETSITPEAEEAANSLNGVVVEPSDAP